MRTNLVGILVVLLGGITWGQDQLFTAPSVGHDPGDARIAYLCLSPLPLVPTEERLAKPTKINGKLECALPDGGGEWQDLAVDADVNSGTVLRTGVEDSAFLSLTDGGELFLGHDSELLLVGYRIVLNRGSLKYQGGSTDETRPFETPDFVIAFTGERIEVQYFEKETQFAILAGSANLRPTVNRANAINVGSFIQGIGGDDGLWFFEPVELSQKGKEWEQIGWAFTPPPAPTPSSTPAAKPLPTSSDDLPPDNMPPDNMPPDNMPPDNMPPDNMPPDSVPPNDTSIGMPPDSEPRPAIPIELPADGSIPIVFLDSTGGYVLPRRSHEPELVIYADGRAVITDPFGKLPRVTRRLSLENLKEFLSFMVNDHHFYDLTTEGLAELQAQILAQSGGQKITDLPTTILRLGLRNKTYEVRFRGAEFWAEKHPDVQQFRDFRAIEARLREFIEQSRVWAKKHRNVP